MELVPLLRELWRVRVLVALVAVFAAGRRRGRVQAALAREPQVRRRPGHRQSLLVDTPNSQVIEVAPKGSDTLGVRANLLANLMAEGRRQGRHRSSARGSRATGLAGHSEVRRLQIAPREGPEWPRRYAYVLTTCVVPHGRRRPAADHRARGTRRPTRASRRQARRVRRPPRPARLPRLVAPSDEQVPDAERLRVSSLGFRRRRTSRAGRRTCMRSRR